jgi:hypothetical protein
LLLAETIVSAKSVEGTMSATNCSFRLMLVGMALLLILACNTPAPQPVVPEVGEAKTAIPPTKKPQSPSTTRPTQKPTNAPTKKSTAIPTNTPLPPLPDFDKVLSFGGGAGGGTVAKDYCQSHFLGEIPAAYGGTSSRFGEIAYLCLWGIPLDAVFQVELISPNTKNTLVSYFKALSSNKTVSWSGHISEEHDSVVYLENGISLIVISPWWPHELPSGSWQIHVTWNGNEINGTFNANGNNVPTELGITTTDPRIWTEILPSGVLEQTLIHPAFVGQVYGRGFSPNSLVYVLAYSDEQTGNYNPTFQKFTYKTGVSVITDLNGNFVASLPDNLDKSRLHILLGITDPNAVLSDPNGFINVRAMEENDIFYFQPSALTFDLSQVSSSCPGAPPQRMTVNQRGYVCTRSDRVRLRTAPAKSADTIVYLDTGTQFTVIDGPSCSDNWSWWNVRLDDGTTGWLAEGGDDVDPYFICPVP